MVNASHLSREGGRRASIRVPRSSPSEVASVGSLTDSDRLAVGATRRRVCSPLTCALVSWYMCPARAQGEGPEEGMALFSLFFPFNCGSTLGLRYRTSPRGMGDRVRSKPGSADDLPQCGAGVKEGLGINKDNGRVLTWQAGFFIGFFLFPLVRPWSFFFI